MKASVARDTEGYLINADDWSEVVATELAHEEGISLNDEYWRVLNFIRSYYDEYGITPDIRHLVKQLASERGIDKKQAKQYLFELFPYGYVKQACKIAGMKRPRAWSTG